VTCGAAIPEQRLPQCYRGCAQRAVGQNIVWIGGNQPLLLGPLARHQQRRREQDNHDKTGQPAAPSRHRASPFVKLIRAASSAEGTPMPFGMEGAILLVNQGD
jgi:hypothetical protein